jgi:hypothetical protein
MYGSSPLLYVMASAAVSPSSTTTSSSISSNDSQQQPPFMRALSMPPILHYRLTDVKTALQVEPWVTTDQLTPKPDDVCHYFPSCLRCVFGYTHQCQQSINQLINGDGRNIVECHS